MADTVDHRVGQAAGAAAAAWGLAILLVWTVSRGRSEQIVRRPALAPRILGLAAIVHLVIHAANSV